MIKISYDIPKDMIEAAALPSIKDNPWNLCLLCPAHNVTCGGPNELAMSSSDFIDRANTLAKQRKLTRADIAMISNMPEPTVVSVMTKRTPDPRHSTMHGISKAVNGTMPNGAPCYMAALLLSGQITVDSTSVDEETLINRINELEVELKDAHEQIEKFERMAHEIHSSYREELDTLRADHKRTVDYLTAAIAKRDDIIQTKDRMIAKMVLGE